MFCGPFWCGRMTARRPWLGSAVALALLGSTSICFAQPIDRSEWGPRRGVSPVLGIAYEPLAGPFLSAGLIVGTVPGKANKCVWGATSEGVLLQGHVGLNGPRLSVGVARFNPVFGAGVKATVLHLWRPAGDSASGTTLVGPEVALSVLTVRVGAGLYWRTGGPEGPSRRFGWSAGLGF